jgi:peptidoglycan/xylan/chitin deacetylase (PgdA/CDA1 family)
MTKTITSTDFSADRLLRFWFYLHNAALSDYNGSVILSFANEAGFTNAYRQWISPSLFFGTGWKRFTYPRSWFLVQAGAPNWASMVRMRIAVAGAATKQAIISSDSFIRDAVGVPFIVLRLDDASAAQYNNCLPYMRDRGIRGTMYAPTSLIGTGGYMTYAQLRELDAAGWTIGNHTRSHVSLTTLTEAQQETELTNGKSDLDTQGLTKGSRYVAYPASTQNTDTSIAMAATGMLTGQNGQANSKGVGSQFPLTLPMFDPFVIPSYGISTALSLATVKGWVDDAIADGVGLGLHFHDVGVGAAQWSTATFQQFIDYLVSKRGQIYPITIDDYYRLTLGPVEIPA